MRLLILSISFLPACTVITGDAARGTYSYASLGGKTTGYAQTPNGVTAAGIDGTESFREINQTARGWIYADAAASVLSTGIAAWKATDLAATRAGTEAARIAGRAEAASIAADVTKATFTP